MKNTLLITAATSFLVACGGGSSSSSNSTPISSETSTSTTASGDCQVVNKEILIAEGKSCSISTATKTEYNLSLGDSFSCTNGKIVTGGFTSSSPFSFNGLTIKCQ